MLQLPKQRVPLRPKSTIAAFPFQTTCIPYLSSPSSVGVSNSKATARVIPRYCSLVAHDEASSALDTVLILEFHLVQTLVSEIVTLCRAPPYAHHMATVITFRSFNDDVCMFMFIYVVANKPQAVLYIIFEQSNLYIVFHIAHLRVFFPFDQVSGDSSNPCLSWFSYRPDAFAYAA